MRRSATIGILVLSHLVLIACGGDDAGGFPFEGGSATVKLETFRVDADQRPDPRSFTITLDGEVVGRSLSGSVDYVISIDSTVVQRGALAIEQSSTDTTRLQEATVTIPVPSDLSEGEHILRGELDPDGHIDDQIDHDLWAVRTETFTITDSPQPVHAFAWAGPERPGRQ